MHMGIDHSGHDDLAASVDLFLFDVKHIDGEAHHSLTGVDTGRILANFRASRSVSSR